MENGTRSTMTSGDATTRLSRNCQNKNINKNGWSNNESTTNFAQVPVW